MKKIVVGSRDSKLAIIQSEMVIKAINDYDPSIRVVLKTMKAKGDICLEAPLETLGSNCFVGTLEERLQSGAVDLVVHSFKDLPLEENPKLPIVAVSKREDPRDVLVLPENEGIIHNGKPIGCSSFRRRRQLKASGEKRKIVSVRGDVVSRLRQLDDGQFSALILAAAGLKRLGLEHRISTYFPLEKILPSPCQGILAIQGRVGDDHSFLEDFHSKDAYYISLGERAFARALGEEKFSEVAVYGELSADDLTLTGLRFADDVIIKKSITGSKIHGAYLGVLLAKKIKDGK